MTVEQGDVVDAIGVEPSSGFLILTISDHLDWRDVDSHLSALRDKLNTYIHVVESGQLLELYADAAGRTVVVDVVIRVPLSREGEEFFRNVERVLATVGMRVRVHGLAGAS